MMQPPFPKASAFLQTCFVWLLLAATPALQAQNRKDPQAQAQTLIGKGLYTEAIHTLNKQLKQARTQQKAGLLYQLGRAYQLQGNPQQAQQYYVQAIAAGSADALYHCAEVLMVLGRYNEALQQLETYLQTPGAPQAALASARQAACLYALQNPDAVPGVQVMAMDTTINHGRSTRNAVYFAGNTIAFSAQRGCSGHFELYTTYPDSDEENHDRYSPPVPMVSPLNTGQHEAPGSLSADRKTFYFTRWNPLDAGDCHIYVSRLFNHRWMEPMKIEGLNQPGYRTMHPHLAADESRLYFASDRPGGQGGLDIWFVNIDSDGNLGEPQNPGAPINTPGDETSPFFHAAIKTLFFSSNALPGYGGLDIYKSELSETGNEWSNPVNLGLPINSSANDSHFIMDAAQETGFLTSDRDLCITCKELAPQTFCPRLYTFGKPALQFTLEGTVYDAATDEPLAGAAVIMVDITSGTAPQTVHTDASGHYTVTLGPGQRIFVKARKSGYFADAGTASTTGLSESITLSQDFFLRPVPQGDTEIPHIDDDGPAAVLTPGATAELDLLYNFLLTNEQLRIEIRSYSDCRGNEQDNLRLSQERAQACVDYLVTRGIKRERLVAKGMGATAPLPGHSCAEIERLKKKDPAQYEVLHRQNRRTAFRVITGD